MVKNGHFKINVMSMLQYKEYKIKNVGLVLDVVGVDTFSSDQGWRKTFNCQIESIDGELVFPGSEAYIVEAVRGYIVREMDLLRYDKRVLTSESNIFCRTGGLPKDGMVYEILAGFSSDTFNPQTDTVGSFRDIKDLKAYAVALNMKHFFYSAVSLPTED